MKDIEWEDILTHEVFIFYQVEFTVAEAKALYTHLEYMETECEYKIERLKKRGISTRLGEVDYEYLDEQRKFFRTMKEKFMR